MEQFSAETQIDADQQVTSEFKNVPKTVERMLLILGSKITWVHKKNRTLLRTNARALTAAVLFKFELQKQFVLKERFKILFYIYVILIRSEFWYFYFTVTACYLRTRDNM